MRVWVVLSCLAGCGRLAFDPLVDPLAMTDASSTGDGARDGASDGASPMTCTTEPFDTPDVQWMFYADAGFSTMFTGGELRFAIPPNSNGYTGVNLVPVRDFTGGRVTIEVPQVSASANAEISMTLSLDANNAYSILYSENDVVLSRRLNGVQDAMVTRLYSATEHRWWRMEHLAGTNAVELATSPDNASWMVWLNTPATIPVTAMTLRLESGEYLGGAPSPGNPRFDNLTYCLR